MRRLAPNGGRSVRRRLIALSVLIVLVASAAMIASWLRSVPVGALITDPDGIDLRLFEEDGLSPSAALRVASGNVAIARVQAILEAGQPTWRWFGYRPDLEDDSYRFEIVTSTCTTRISVSGMMHMTYADGRHRKAVSPRSEHLYDDLAAIVKTHADSQSPGGP